MSRENVETVRRIYAAFESFDRGTPEATAANPDVLAFVQETIDPDVELEQLAAIPGTGGTFRGYAGLLAAWQELAEGFEGLRFVPQREFDAGEGRVVVDVLALATGRESGVRPETRLGHLLELRDGRVVRWTVFPTLAEALEAVGLPE